MARSKSGFSDTWWRSFWFRPTHAVTTRQMSEVHEAWSGLTPSATELCDVINWQIKIYMDTTSLWLSRGDVPTPDKNFHQRFFFSANSCHQINIFCAKFIISLHFATMATASTNPGRLITSLNPPIERITWFEDTFGKLVCRMYPQCSNQIGQYAIVIPSIVRYCFSII